MHLTNVAKPTPSRCAEYYTPRLFAAPLLGDKRPPPKINATCLLCGGWIMQLCCLTNQQVMDQTGLDGYMLAQTTSTLCRVFSVFTFMSLLFLVPLAYTAAEQPDAISRAGLDNMPDGSPRLWAWVVVLYIITFVALAAVYGLSTEYAILRRKFLRDSVLAGISPGSNKPDFSPSAAKHRRRPSVLSADAAAARAKAEPTEGPTQRTTATTVVDLEFAAECAVREFGEDGSFAWPRTVLATDIPPHVDDSPKLRQLFEAMYPGQVEAATLLTDSGDVDDLQGERDETAVLYETARWLHRSRTKPIQRVVYANRCGCIAFLCGVLGINPLAVEDSRALVPTGTSPPATKAKKDEEGGKDGEDEDDDDTPPPEASRYILNQAVSMEREALSYALDPFYMDASFWDDPPEVKGNYCCCCLPCGVFKRGGMCSWWCLCLRPCCGSVEAALPRLRRELLKLNYDLGEQRISWWKKNHKEELQAMGVVFKEEAPVVSETAAKKAAAARRRDRFRGRKAAHAKEADQKQPPGAEAGKDEAQGKKGTFGIAGGAGFVTFKSVRLAVLASTGYHMPAVDFKNESEPASVPISPTAPPPECEEGAGGGGASDKAARPKSKLARMATAAPGKLLGGGRSKIKSLNLREFVKAAGKIASTPPMGVSTAPHPLDVNFKAAAKPTREREAAQWFVLGLRIGLLVLYSFLAIAVSSGGGNTAASESSTSVLVVNGTTNGTLPADVAPLVPEADNSTAEDSGGTISISSPDDALSAGVEFFWTVYSGLGQSFLLAVLLNLLPTILMKFAELSLFRVSSDVSGFMIENLFAFKAWTAIVMVVLGKSLQATLTTIVEQPFSLIRVLGTQLPSFASFYISFVLLKALADYPRSLIQPFGLAVYVIIYRRMPNFQNLLDTTIASAAQAFNAAAAVASAVPVPKGKEGGPSEEEKEEKEGKSGAPAGANQGGRDSPAGGSGTEAGMPMPQYIRPPPPEAQPDTKASPPPVASPSVQVTPQGMEAGEVALWEAAEAEEEAKEEGKAAVAKPVPREDLEVTAAEFFRSPRQFMEGVVDGPGEFDYEDALSELLFVNLLGFMFGGMVPMLPPLIVLCFTMMGLTMRYQLIYLNAPTRDAGAAWLPRVVNRIVFALIAQQLVLASLLLIQGQPAAGGLCLLPALVTYLFLGVLNNRVFLAANKLSVKEAAEADIIRAAMMGTRPQKLAMSPATMAKKARKAARKARRAAAAGQAPKALSREEEERIVGQFMEEMLKTHAYIPPSLLPHRDIQPGVITLPSAVEVELEKSRKEVVRPPPAMASGAAAV